MLSYFKQLLRAAVVANPVGKMSNVSKITFFATLPNREIQSIFFESVRLSQDHCKNTLLPRKSETLLSNFAFIILALFNNSFFFTQLLFPFQNLYKVCKNNIFEVTNFYWIFPYYLFNYKDKHLFSANKIIMLISFLENLNIFLNWFLSSSYILFK